jgi:diguanylate cyclase (GGDEF)-like protein
MILQGNVTGMISAQSYQPNAYTRDDQYLLELLASHAAIAIENSRLFATVQHLADTDPLTGVLSRRKFFELTDREFSRMKRYGKPLSVLMLDVDEFKKFNDWFGHQVGDLVLKAVALQCRSSLRDVDIFGRIGGEEFAVTLPDTGVEQALQVASRLCAMVEQANLEDAGNLFKTVTGKTFDKDALKVTISIGVAACDDACENVEILMDHADRAMYSVKVAGRNRISVWKDGE